jgi:hypothetical protein
MRRGERLAGKIISAGPDRDNHANGLILSRGGRGQQYGQILTARVKSQILERVARPNVAAQAKIAVEMMQKLRATVAMAWVPIPRRTAESRTARSAIAKMTFTGNLLRHPSGYSAKCKRQSKG